MKNKRSAARLAAGYSLLELLIAVAVLGVLSALALPAFSGMIRDGRRTSVVNDLVVALHLARAESVKRGSPIVVCGIRDADRDGAISAAERTCAGRDWSDGWIVATWRDANADGTVDAPELTVLREFGQALPGVTIRANSLSATPPVAPAGTGVIKPFNRNSSNGTITICDRRGAPHARAVVISASGRARLANHRPGGGPLVCP